MTKLDPKPRVQLVGADGNGFFIVARVVAALKKAGATPEQVIEYREDAMSGDYDHLLNVTMEWVDDLDQDETEEWDDEGEDW